MGSIKKFFYMLKDMLITSIAEVLTQIIIVTL